MRRRTKREWERRARKASPVALVVLTVVAVALIVLAFYRQNDVAPSSGEPIVKSTPTVPDQTVVVIMGDSFTGGSDMNTGPTWAEQLAAEHPDWVVATDAVGGTGYVSAGQSVPFIDRVDESLGGYAADLLIVAGGRNDTGSPAPQIAAAADTFLSRVHEISPSTDVLMLSPWASGEPTPQILAIAGEFKTLARRHHATYFDVTRVIVPSGIGEDGVHPNDDGHAAMLAAIDAELVRLDLPRPGAFEAN